MDNATNASAATSLASCGIYFANNWGQFLTDHGQQIVTLCALVTTMTTVLGFVIKLSRGGFNA